MEILATNELIGVFVLLLALFGAILLIGITLFITCIKDMFEYFEWGALLFSAIGVVVITLGTLGCYGIFKEGAPIQYKATITDFNEVYNNGYEIVDQEGDLYILEKN